MHSPSVWIYTWRISQATLRERTSRQRSDARSQLGTKFSARASIDRGAPTPRTFHTFFTVSLQSLLLRKKLGDAFSCATLSPHDDAASGRRTKRRDPDVTQGGIDRAPGFGWPLSTIFVMQSVITMAIYALPVIMPVAAVDLGLAPQSVGFLVSAIYLVSTVGGLFSQTLIARLGATGVFRMLLAFTALSVVILISGLSFSVWLAVAILGLGSGPMNPAGSHVLAKVVPAHRRAFIFSLKQCATPVGGMLAGIVLPPLMLAYGWHSAMAIIPVVAIVLWLLAPVGRLGRRATDVPVEPFSVRRTVASLAVVWRHRSVRISPLLPSASRPCRWHSPPISSFIFGKSLACRRRPRASSSRVCIYRASVHAWCLVIAPIASNRPSGS